MSTLQLGKVEWCAVARAMRLLRRGLSGPPLCLALSISCREQVTPPQTACARPESLACGAKTICPQGTYCAGSDTSAPRCAVDRPGDGGNALTAGFAVSEFLLAPAADSPSTYELRIPRGAEIINCALFVCSPSVWHDGAGASISNFGECAHANRVLDVRDFGAEERLARLDLSTLEPLQSERPCAPTAAARGALRTPLVSTLQLGCLAFDNRRVIRATRLLELAPANLPPSAELPVGDCTSAQDTQGRLCVTLDGGVCGAARDSGATECVEGTLGRCVAGSCLVEEETTTALVEALLSNPPLVIDDCAATPFTDAQNCYPSLLGGYGTCIERQCRPRCVEDTDCHRLGEEVVGRCSRTDSSLLGLCLPEAPDAG